MVARGCVRLQSRLAAVDVQEANEFPSAIKSLAIAPLPCSQEVNCVKIKKYLDKSVARIFPAAVVGADQFKQELFELSVMEPDKEIDKILKKALE